MFDIFSYWQFITFSWDKIFNSVWNGIYHLYDYIGNRIDLTTTLNIVLITIDIGTDKNMWNEAFLISVEFYIQLEFSYIFVNVGVLLRHRRRLHEIVAQDWTIDTSKKLAFWLLKPIKKMGNRKVSQ